jgi:hypothetical protein
MKYTFLSIIAALLLFSFAACDDSTTVGNSLTGSAVTIVVDSDFTVTGSTVENPVVQSRTISQLLGKINADGFGSIYSDFVAQFMPSLALDTDSTSAADIDSVKLFLQMTRDSFVGDSLVPMGLEVYRLTDDLPYPIYSDYDPTGHYDPIPLAATSYIASSMNEPDSVQELTNLYVSVPLPVSFGRELYNAYVNDPSSFADPEVFTNKVFKGLYVRSTYGAGRISNFTITSIRLFYHKVEWDADSAAYITNKYNGDYFAVTPEVVVNNNIRYSMSDKLRDMMAAGDQVLAAPAGTEIELRFPGPELLASYGRYGTDLRVLNSLTFEIPVDSIANDNQIGPPPYALLILKKDKDKFFANNSLTDNITSFYATYDSSTGSYSFTSMRDYLLYLQGLDTVTEDDYTFVLTPVQVNFESTATSSSSYYYYYYYGSSSSSYVESTIVPYVSTPAMARVRLSDAKIKLTFSAGNRKDL